MSKIRITLNRRGIRQLLLSDEVQAVCNQYAYRAVAQLGDGYEVSYRKGKNRVNAEVAAVSEEAKRENLETNSILKVVGGL